MSNETNDIIQPIRLTASLTLIASPLSFVLKAGRAARVLLTTEDIIPHGAQGKQDLTRILTMNKAASDRGFLFCLQRAQACGRTAQLLRDRCGLTEAEWKTKRTEDAAG